MVKTADSEQSNVWDFNVEQAEFVNPFDSTKKTGVFGVFRRDTNQFVGQYKGEKVLPYRDLVQTTETSIERAGLAIEKRSIVTTANGGRFFAEYTLAEKNQFSGESYDSILVLQGSYNGSLRHGLAYKARRLACLNGMEIMETVCAMFKKVSEENDLEFITDDLAPMIEMGQNRVSNLVERMGNLQITDGQARNIVSNIVELGKLKGVSPKTGHLMYNNWVNPSKDETILGDTLYRLYNATTRLTRDIASVGRFEMSRKANVFVTGAFDLAVNGKHNLEKLLATPAKPLEFDSVAVNN